MVQSHRPWSAREFWHAPFLMWAGSPLLSQPGVPPLLENHHIDAKFSVDTPKLLDSSDALASAPWVTGTTGVHHHARQTENLAAILKVQLSLSRLKATVSRFCSLTWGGCLKMVYEVICSLVCTNQMFWIMVSIDGYTCTYIFLGLTLYFEYLNSILWYKTFFLIL